MSTIPPSHISSGQPGVSQDPVQAVKDYFRSLINSDIPEYRAVGKPFYDLIQNLTNLDDIKSALTSFVSNTGGGCDIYIWCMAEANVSSQVIFENVNYNLQNIMNWQIAYPPATMMDEYCSKMLMYTAYFPSPTATNIWNGLRPEIVKLGSGGDIQEAFNEFLSNPQIFSLKPPLDLTVLDSMMSNANAYYRPDFFNLYLSIGYSSSQTPLEKALLNEMVNVYLTGSTQGLQQWLPQEIFSLLPSGLSSNDIVNVALQLGLALPSYFTTYFNAFSALLPRDPTSADYQMIMDFQTQWITAMWPDKSAQDLQTWFENNYGTPGQAAYPSGVDDLYIRYPGADPQMIQSLVNVLFPSAPSYAATSFDTAYRAIYAKHGTETSGFWHDLIVEYQKAGSSDSGQGLEQWIDTVALTAFSQYPEMSASDVMTFLAGYPFKITASGNSPICDYVTAYIQIVWEKQPGRTANEIKFGNQVINEIEAYEGGFSSLQDLKTYILKRIPTYESQWKTIPPATITGLFQLFGLYP